MTTTVSPAVLLPTRSDALLCCGAIAAPLWAVVALAQAATRADFDLTQHPLSALSTGSMGWVQITNFLVYGILMFAGAVGLRRAIPNARWLAWFTAANAVTMFLSGVLVMDAPPGFPAGNPGPGALSWHGIGHMVVGTLAFGAIAAACVAVGTHFRRVGRPMLGAFSYVAACAVLLGDGWATTGAPFGSLTIAIGVIPAMLWVSAFAARCARTTPST